MSVVSTTVRPSVAEHHAPGPHKFTIEEYFELARLNFISGRTELVSGEIIHMPPIGMGHSLALEDLRDLLRQAFPKPWCILTQSTHNLGPNDAREPDIRLLRESPPLTEIPGPIPVELIVEIAATSLVIDLGEKRLQYARHQVPEYWVVDLKRSVVHVLREPNANATVAELAYRRVEVVGVTGTLRPLANPGATIKVADFMPSAAIE